MKEKNLHSSLKSLSKRLKGLFVFCLFFVVSFSATAQFNTDRIIANGRVALYYKDYFLSIQYFNQVIKVKPYLAEPYMYRAFAKLYLDEYTGAESDCTLALDLNPFLPEAYTARAYARMGQLKYEDAIADLTKAMEFSPDNVSLLTTRGAAYAEHKDNDAAMQDYGMAIKKDPKNKYTYYERGRLYFTMNDTIAALNDFTKVIDLDKFGAMGWSARGLVYLRSGKYKEAIQDLNEAILLEERAGDFFNRALARYHTNDLRGAMADYDKGLDLNPNEFLGYYNRGLLRAQVGDNNRALEDFDMVLRFNPEEYTAVLNRALLRVETGDMQGAIADYTTIINKYPNFFPAYYMRSEAKAKIGQKKSAELDYNTAAYMEDTQRQKSQNKPKNQEDKTREESDNDIGNYKKIVVVDTEKEKKKLPYKDDQYRGEIQNVNVEIKPEKNFFFSYYSPENKIKTPMIHFYRGVDDYNKRHKSDDQLRITNNEIQLSNDLIVTHLSLINELSRRIESNPNDADAYFARAINYGLTQDFDNAIDSYNKAIILNSNAALYYFSRANIRYKMLDYESSAKEVDVKKQTISLNSKLSDQQYNANYELIIRDYNKALELDPKFIYAYFNRANLSFTNNDFLSAIDDYTSAIQIEPDFAEAYFNRGLAYILSGNKKKGLADLSKAGELGMLPAYNIIKRYS